MSMKSKQKKGKFVPKAGGKKKKRKKRRNTSNNEPERDPHFRESVLLPKREKKSQRRRATNFEADMEAPTVEIISSNPFGGGGGYGGGRNSNRRQGDNNSKFTAKKRRPRGTRTVVSSGGGSSQMRKIYTNLETAERSAQVQKKVFSPKIFEENSGDELMDIDNEEKKNENTDYDPWNDENDDIQYTPITLKTKPKFGENGIFLQTDMLNVFEEKEYGINGKEFIFMQMPPVLPLVSHLNEDEKHDLANNKNVEQSLLRQMGEGKIGKIRIRKSGKTELVIGDFVMDINFASPMDCYQQVMHVHCENTSDRQIRGKSQFLGDVPPQNNLVCSYRAEDLLL